MEKFWVGPTSSKTGSNVVQSGSYTGEIGYQVMIVKAYEQRRKCKYQYIGDHEYIGGTYYFMLDQFLIHFYFLMLRG